MKPVTLRTIIFLFLVFSPLTSALADRQANVDYVVDRIDSVLKQSLERRDWRSSYSLAMKNIEDLENTLRLGGKVRRDPVAAFHKQLGTMLQERREVWEKLLALGVKYEKARKNASQQALRDIGMEFINSIKPRPSALDPFSKALSKNMQIIKNDIWILRTAEQGVRLIEDYKRSIQPAIHDMRDRYHALGPLVQAFAAASKEAGFDGQYVGTLQGGASGSISFTVTGQNVTGTVEGSYKGDRVNGQFTGSVGVDGRLSTRLNGSVIHNMTVLGHTNYSGTLSGQISSGNASGSWRAGTSYEMPSGGWRASKR